MKRTLLLFCGLFLCTQVNEVTCAVSSCHAKLIGSSGTFTSPNYPEPPNAPSASETQNGFITCQWEIEVPDGMGIQLKFGDFDMDASQYPDDCEKGEVEVYSGIGKERISLDKYCPENHPDTVTIESNASTVVFRRPSSFTGTGFLISFIAITPRRPIADFVTCSDKINLWKDVEIFSVVCPSGCGNIKGHEVYGNMEYRDENTHLCRAAVHAGVISDLFGGRVDAKRGPGEAIYVRMTANNISALSGPMSDYKCEFPAAKECRDTIPLKRSQFAALSYANTTDIVLKSFYSWRPANALFDSANPVAWSPGRSDKPQWIQIDLEKDMNITGIITRGSQDPYSQTRLYQIKWSKNNVTWHYYTETDPKRPKIFTGNDDFYSSVRNNFVNPTIIAKHIRVYPFLNSCEPTRCGMKIALTGCDVSGVTPETDTTTTTLKITTTTTTTTPTTTPRETTTTTTDQTTFETKANPLIVTDKDSSSKPTIANRTVVQNVHDNSNEEGGENGSPDKPDNGDGGTKITDINERTILIIAVVAGLGVTCLLLAALVFFLVIKRKKDPQSTAVPKINSRDNATYNDEIGMNSIYKNNNKPPRKKKRGENSQKGVDFVNGNYRDTLSNSNSGTEDSFLNSRGGVTLRYGQNPQNGSAVPVRASYSTNSDGAGVSGQVGNILYDSNAGNFATQDDHEYEVIDTEPFPGGPASLHSSITPGRKGSGALPPPPSNDHAWNRRSYGDHPQRMSSFAAPDVDESSRPLRSGTFPHKKRNNVIGDESNPLLQSSSRPHHSTTFTAPRTSNYPPGQLPPKKSGNNFSQHPFTSRSSSSSQNSGFSDLHRQDSIPQDPYPQEEMQLLQQSERGRKASYNVPNNIPVDPPLSTFSTNTPPRTNGSQMLPNGNGIPNDPGLLHSMSRSESLNHARLRSGYDQLYRPTPTSDASLPKAKMSTSDYNQLNLHSSAA